MKFIFIIYLFGDTNIATNLIKLKQIWPTQTSQRHFKRTEGVVMSMSPPCTYIVVLATVCMLIHNIYVYIHVQNMDPMVLGVAQRRRTCQQDAYVWSLFSNIWGHVRTSSKWHVCLRVHPKFKCLSYMLHVNYTSSCITHERHRERASCEVGQGRI